MGLAHVAEVPGLVADASEGLLPGRVALEEAVGRGQVPEGLADALIGKGGADKVQVVGPQA